MSKSRSPRLWIPPKVNPSPASPKAMSLAFTYAYVVLAWRNVALVIYGTTYLVERVADGKGNVGYSGI